MERRKFTREFKLEAVRLIKERGVGYARASQDLGVHPTQLRSWVRALAHTTTAQPAKRRHHGRAWRTANSPPLRTAASRAAMSSAVPFSTSAMSRSHRPRSRPAALGYLGGPRKSTMRLGSIAIKGQPSTTAEHRKLRTIRNVEGR
jgi:transposase-like protein